MTQAEAECLRWCAGNFMDYPDTVREQFPNPQRRAAAVRAFEKLEAAIAKVEGR
jgi:hypothetical protein